MVGGITERAQSHREIWQGLAQSAHKLTSHGITARIITYGATLQSLLTPDRTGRVADVALGYAIAFSTKPPTSLITASLSLDFAGTANIGDWLEARVDVQKKGSRLAFANCYISVGESRIVRASAVFVVAGELKEH